MAEDARNLAQRVQEQTLNSAHGFFGASLRRLGEQLASDRSQLEDLERQLDHEDARARIRELVESCSAIEASIAEALRDLGPEDEASEKPRLPQDAGGRGDRSSPGETGQEVGGVLNTASGAAEDAMGTASEVAGQVTGKVEQVAENLPGGQLLGRTTDGYGRTVQRVVCGSGEIIQTTLDASWELVDEDLVGNLTDLPTEEESTTEEGHTLRTVRDESGALVRLRLGPDGDVLDLEVLPDDR